MHWLIQTIIQATLTIGITWIIIRLTIPKFIRGIMEEIAEMLENVFANPTVKKAYSILGGKSGESRRNKALENEIASGVFDKTIGKYKVILGAIGIDLDSLMERYTPMELLAALETFAPMLQSFGLGKDLKTGRGPSGYGAKY